MRLRSTSRFLFVFLLSLMIIGSGFLAFHVAATHAKLPSLSLSQQSNWSMTGYNAQHTGYNPNEHILSRSNVAKLALSWSYPINSTSSDGPVVANGIAYIGSYNKGMYAFNAKTGALLWMFPVANISFYAPVVADGMVYFTAHQGVVSTLYTLNAKTGKVKWKYSVKKEYIQGPVIDHNTIYINITDGSLDALDAQTGKIKWRSATKAGGFTAPTIADGVAYVASISTLYAISLKTGHMIWQYNAVCFTSQNYASTVADGFVYIGTCNQGLLAVSTTTGKLQWSDIAGSAASVYVATSKDSRNDILYALDARTGHVKWAYYTGTNFSGSSAIANNVVYFSCIYSCPEGSLYGLDATTGHLLWHYNGSFSSSPPVIANGFLYTITGDAIQAFQVPSSKP